MRGSALAELALAEARPSSGGWLRASCPYCALEGKRDKKASFGVSPRGYYSCFRCGVEGWFQAAYVAEIEVEAKKAKLWGDVDAIRTKRDMLVELGATRRKEMESDPLIRERHAQARVQREG